MPEFGSYPEKESPAAGDFLLVLDGDDATTKKVDVGNLPGGSGGGGFAASESRLSAFTDGGLPIAWSVEGAGYGIEGSDLAINDDGQSIDVLTAGVYSVFVGWFVLGDVAYGALNVSCDEASGFDVTLDLKSDVAPTYAGTFSYTFYLAPQSINILPYVKTTGGAVLTQFSEEYPEGIDALYVELRIQRLA